MMVIYYEEIFFLNLMIYNLCIAYFDLDERAMLFDCKHQSWLSGDLGLDRFWCYWIN